MLDLVFYTLKLTLIYPAVREYNTCLVMWLINVVQLALSW